MTKEVMAYLSMLYGKVASIEKQGGEPSGFYKLYTGGNDFFIVCDDDGNIILDMLCRGAAMFGPFIKFDILTAENLVNDDFKRVIKTAMGEDYEYVKFRSSFSLTVSLYKLLQKGFFGIIDSGDFYSTLSSEFVRKVADGLYAMRDYKCDRWAFYDNYGEQVTPFIYDRYQKPNKVTSTYVEFKARYIPRVIPGETRISIKRAVKQSGPGAKAAGDWVMLKYNRGTHKFDYYFLATIGIGRYAAATSYYTVNDQYNCGGRIRKINQYKMRFRLMDYSERFFGKEYESIEDCSVTFFGKRVYIVRNNENCKNFYNHHSYGYITEDGEELIPPNIAYIASPMGNSGLFLVVNQEKVPGHEHEQQSLGIWSAVNQKFVESLRDDTVYTEKRMGDITVWMAEINRPYKEKLRFIVGNDGKLYDDFKKAFEVYRSSDNQYYIIILYGKKYYCEASSLNNFTVIKHGIKEREYSWEKVS